MLGIAAYITAVLGNLFGPIYPSSMAQHQKRKPFAQRRQLMKALGDRAPKFSLAIGPQFPRGSDYATVIPFRRSLIFILISGAFLAVFALPLIGVLSEASMALDDDLFSLVAFLFGLFWSLGWSVGVFILLLVFLAVTIGRETLAVKNNELILRIGIPLIGFGATYSASMLRNIRRQGPDEMTGFEWRGHHLAFDYAGETIAFGSAIEGQLADEMLSELRRLFPEQDSPAPNIPKPAADLDETIEQSEARRDSKSPFEVEPDFTWRSISSLALIGANIVPLAGVLFLGWDIGEIMLLFWAESAVIGFYNLIKMGHIASWAILFYGPFFVGHYGGFMVGHLLFIYGFFGDNFAEGADITIGQLSTDLMLLAPALLGFVISHGISYVTNFRQRREYVGMDVSKQMGQPYKRIIIMHLTIIFGGFAAMALDTALPALILLVVLKLVADLNAHIKEHRPPA